MIYILYLSIACVLPAPWPRWGQAALRAPRAWTRRGTASCRRRAPARAAGTWWTWSGCGAPAYHHHTHHYKLPSRQNWQLTSIINRYETMSDNTLSITTDPPRRFLHNMVVQILCGCWCMNNVCLFKWNLLSLPHVDTGPFQNNWLPIFLLGSSCKRWVKANTCHKYRDY